MAGTILGAWDSLADKIRSLLRGSTTYSDSYSKAHTFLLGSQSAW